MLVYTAVTTSLISMAERQDHLAVILAFSQGARDMDQHDSPQRVAYYVDGFNLYHGCFDNLENRESWRPFRWLDIHSMCSRIFPNGETELVRYFTATVDARPDNPDTSIKQQMYLRALRASGNVDIHLGRFSRYAKIRTVADPDSKAVTPKMPEEHQLVIETREKGSDVNLASFLLLDGFRDRYDLAVVISNDSDLATPIRMVRDELDKRVAIINPRKKLAFDLHGIADSYKRIRRTWLENAQLPESLMDEIGGIHRPESWK